MTDVQQIMRQRQRQYDWAEQAMLDAAEAAVRELLRRMNEEAQKGLGVLTASGPAFNASQLFTLGQAMGWWEGAVAQHIVGTVGAVWHSGYYGGDDLVVSSLSSSEGYIAHVTDRLSRTASPTIAEGAFDQVRVALADEIGMGSSLSDVSRRIASDLSWTGPDRGFWEGRYNEQTRRLEEALNGYGPPGSKARLDAQRNDPFIRSLQLERNAARAELDRDQSIWKTRADRIARTESTGALNAGLYQSQLDSGHKVHAWLAFADDRTRESHLFANGQCKPIGEPFIVGGSSLMFPGMAGGPAHEVINCRCTTISGATCEELGSVLGQPSSSSPFDDDEDILGFLEEDDPVGMHGGMAYQEDLDIGDPSSYTRFDDPLGYFQGDETDERLQRLWANEDDMGFKFRDSRDFDRYTDAIESYQGEHYDQLNRALRGVQGGLDDHLTGTQTVRDLTRDLDEAIFQANRTPEGMVTYRGVENGSFAERIRSLEPGAMIGDDGYMSTTIDQTTARQFAKPHRGGQIMEIEIPEGTQALWMNANPDSVFPNELELLVARGAKMEVVDQQSGTTVLRVIGFDRDAVV